MIQPTRPKRAGRFRVNMTVEVAYLKETNDPQESKVQPDNFLSINDVCISLCVL